MKKIKMVSKFSAITFLVLITSLGAFFFNVGQWLLISDPVPANLSVVFTFAGEQERVTYSRELHTSFSRSYWVLSDYRNGYSRLLKKSNYDMSRVAVVDTCKNTYSEVNALDQWLLTNAPSLLLSDTVISIGLVSGPYHMRRINLMINHKFKTGKVHFYRLPVPLERYKWSASMFQYWWKNQAISRIVISEIQKICYFLLIS